MRRSATPLVMVLACLALGGAAQAQPSPDLQEQQEVIQAVLDFRADLFARDSTLVAGCAIDKVIGPAGAQRLRLPGARLATPNTDPVISDRLACAVMRYQRPGRNVLWLESVVEVTRRGGLVEHTPAARQYEVTFQWLHNADYREWHRYTMQAGNRTAADRFADWRVLAFRVAGWMWDHHDPPPPPPPRN